MELQCLLRASIFQPILGNSPLSLQILLWHCTESLRLGRSSSPTPTLKHGHIEPVAWDRVQLGFEYLWGWRLHNLFSHSHNKNHLFFLFSGNSCVSFIARGLHSYHWAPLRRICVCLPYSSQQVFMWRQSCSHKAEADWIQGQGSDELLRSGVCENLELGLRGLWAVPFLPLTFCVPWGRHLTLPHLCFFSLH